MCPLLTIQELDNNNNNNNNNNDNNLRFPKKMSLKFKDEINNNHFMMLLSGR